MVLIGRCFFLSAFSCIPLWANKCKLSRADNSSCENGSLCENNRDREGVIRDILTVCFHDSVNENRR